MASEDPTNPGGVGAGKNTDPSVTVTIPAERNTYMRAAASSWKDKVSPAQFDTILTESYHEKPTLMGMMLQADLEERFNRVIKQWEPDSKFWDTVIELIGQVNYEILKEKLNTLRTSGTRDYTELQRILKAIKNNEKIYASDLRDNFDDYRLEQLLLELYSTKVRAGKQFGGKKRNQKNQKKRKTQGKKKLHRKSSKSRKGKGRK